MQTNNMRWYIVVGIVVLSAAVLFTLVYTSLRNFSTIQQPSEYQASSTIPIQPSGNTSSSIPAKGTEISLSTQGGLGVTVKDFIHNGETVADVVNPGSYVLAGSLGYCLADGSCPHGADTDDFSILYSESTQFLRIILLKEPLGSVRESAERFIIDRLGITEQEACSLKYVVGTPYWINAAYDNKNLGFSFCPDATVLPK